MAERGKKDAAHIAGNVIISVVNECCAEDVGDCRNVYSLSSHFRTLVNWSTHGHIHTKILIKLGPDTTEKFVYIYSNSGEMAATIRDVDELKMFAWDNEVV